MKITVVKNSISVKAFNLAFDALAYFKDETDAPHGYTIYLYADDNEGGRLINHMGLPDSSQDSFIKLKHFLGVASFPATTEVDFICVRVELDVNRTTTTSRQTVTRFKDCMALKLHIEQFHGQVSGHSVFYLYPFKHDNSIPEDVYAFDGSDWSTYGDCLNFINSYDRS
jgi:hypothetical protein